MDVIYAVILYFHILIFGPSGTVQPNNTGGTAPPIIRAAHKYHGILYSLQGIKGEYFIRNGRRCKLLTKAFLSYYKDKKR